MELTEIQTLAEKVRKNISEVIVGKTEVIDHLLVSLIASGHVLLEDVPGMGKTLLAKSMAKSLSCTFNRIQFTPDLLPTDITGINFFSQVKGEFQFRPGPVFSNILLGDEINRATPRTQSSLLESMEEKQVTVDGETRKLDQPFMVIATQNPVENQGTFPLPEAQLDRFLLKVKLGYPTKSESIDILKRFKDKDPLEEIEAVVTKEELLEAQHIYRNVHVSDDILGYIIDIVEQTRQNESIALGVSPRGSQALLKAVQAYAAIKGRTYVIPDDVKQMVKAVLGHRIQVKQRMGSRENRIDSILEEILTLVTVPADDPTKEWVAK
ncbi:AAA family ATPase [Aquibacillus salsiterrae]|uniref:MoxR family ATPase n=1 Tax=Aquibacillus salsiterrae TaxID=2950439 RepID=A0A9X4AFJ4_9BACI|nr:MoxR family ATPase [Aquibacillus salsiterrae]MDC3417971.1 MoxR family ATPase [Aquibacillus salsiterrae]